MRAPLLDALLLAGASPAALAQQAPRPAAVAVAPLAFTQRTLPNGLRVFAMRDTTTPNVSIQVWYDVGARDDPRGRSGFAHLFEHLMFKATKNLVPEQFDRLTEDVGGYNNASTDDDFTNYFEVVPANHLERLLFAEADRMANLAVEQSTFASERDVVKEEFRQRILAQPYGKLFGLYVPQVAYAVAPYARPPIGSIADLDAASIDDVRAFHATYYRPDNAVLVVSGNFDPAQLNRWIDTYFAPIARPSAPIPRVTATEPARAAPIARTVYEANTPLPAVLLNWHVPPDRDADAAALSVVDAVLSTGESSRLYQSLVYRDRLANTAEAQLDTRKGVGNFNVFAIMAGGKSVADGEAALRREVARLRDAPVTAAELARAKAQIVTAALKRRQTAEGRAFILASGVILDGDPHAADTRLAAIQRVTAADVQAAARRYLGDATAATIRYLPSDGKTAGDTIAVAPGVVTVPLVAPAGIAVVTPADAAHRIAPPAPGGAVAATLPTPSEVRLANGLRVVTVERHDLPLVTAAVVALGGAGTDPADRAGAASLAATVMAKGTATRDATAIAADMETLGASVGTAAGRDSALVSTTVTTPAAPSALGILADIVRHPTFAAAELDRARAQQVDGVIVAMSSPPQLAQLVADRAVFGAAPYGAPVEGTPASLAAIARGDLQASYQATWAPERTALVMVGDITPAAARSLAERAFGDWRGAAASPAAMPPRPTAAAPAPRVIVVDSPDAGQAGVVVARAGIARRDPHYAAVQVANSVLGGGFSSRLNTEVRIKRGLAYGAGSNVAARRDGGEIAARTQTKNPTAAEVAQLIVAEMRRMGTEPVAAGELDTRKASLVGEVGRATETTEGIATTLGNYITTGVPVADLPQAVARLTAVDAGGVRAVGTAFDPAAASVVVVGDARQFLLALRKAYPQVEVIPIKQLKLDTPTLR